MNFTGSGQIKFGGCASTYRSVYISYKWGENSVVYVKHKALKGILERVAIKRVILNSGPKTFNKIVPIYEDTFNSLWNEDDLLYESEAREFALAYWQKREADLISIRC